MQGRRRVGVNVRMLLERAFDPAASVVAQRTDFLVDVVRAWAEPISVAELAELLEWNTALVRQAMQHAVADGRIGHNGKSGNGARPRLYHADPDITATLTGGRTP